MPSPLTYKKPFYLFMVNIKVNNKPREYNNDIQLYR